MTTTGPYVAVQPESGLPREPLPEPLAEPFSPAAPESAPAEQQPPATAPAEDPRAAPAEAPRWARPALAIMLVVTAALYLWQLGDSGWANAYYSAAVEAASESWKAFVFGSFDAANFVTVDKPPAALWVMALSARVFGVNSWAILVPQALMGVASVGVLYAAVRRWHGAAAGLIAGSVLALTPVAALMFRFNNPDALLVLLLTIAAYAVVRAVEGASTRWLVAAGVLVGVGFLTKMMQAFIVVPVFAAVYLVAADTPLRRRLLQVGAFGAATFAASAWWVAIVELWPEDSRPYIGGSQTNSVLELIFGYNGLGRITGNETGSVVPGGGAAAGGMWGETGIGRLFNASYGGQVSWLIPAALVLLGGAVWATLRSPRTDRLRASMILWGGWLVVTGLVISFAAGIIHEYYTVALAPAIGAVVGIGSTALWSRRDQVWARAVLSGALAVTAIWSADLLGRSADFVPWLRPLVLVGGLGVAAVLLVGHSLDRRVVLGVAGAGLVLALAGPTAYALETVTTPHTGALPSAGPTVAGARGGPGGQVPGGTGGQVPGGTGGSAQAFPGFPGGQFPNLSGGAQGQAFPGLPGGQGRIGTPGGTGGTGATGGLLEAGEPSADVVAALTQDADSYTWVAAAVGANSAAGFQLAANLPVMAIGGFNGSDPAPTLAQFQQYVAQGRIHYFIAGGMGGPGGAGPGGAGPGGLAGGQMGGSSASSEIAAWVAENFDSVTVDGTTMYDLSTGTDGVPA